MTPAPAADDVWMGLDLGTQSVRALAVTTSGHVVGSGSQPLRSSRSGGLHEQDPEQWWDAVCAATHEAMSQVSPGAVQGVAVDATSGSLLLTDVDGAAVTPALMYDDNRAAEQVDQVNEVGQQLWTRLGYRRMQPTWALPKLLWLLRHHPEAVPGARLTHQADFVNRRLVGRDVPTDLATSLKAGVDLLEEAWPEDIFEALQVPTEMLPQVVRSGTPIGAVSSGAAEATGLPFGVPVVAGTTDGCAAQLGAGALAEGSWNSVLGSTLVLKGVTGELLHDPLGVVYSHKSPTGQWLPGGASSTGAGALTRDFPDRDLADLDRRATAHEPAAVVTYPLVGAGERFPFAEAEARGFTLGESGDESERFAALLQGVAFVERLCFDYLDLLGAATDGTLSLTGGAARSDYWCQLRSDILGREVTRPAVGEPALGTALLAASSRGDLVDVAAEMVRVRDVLEPRTQLRGRFDTAYCRLVDELENRGWLDHEVAAHAQARTGR